MRLRVSTLRKLGASLLAVASVLACVPARRAHGQINEAFATGKPRGRTHPLRVQGGVLTVDGLTVKTGLDLHVPSFRYLFIFVPGSGTAVISDQPFAGAHEQRSAFRGSALTVQAGERRLQLTAVNRIRGTRSAFVRFDRGLGPALRVPAVSYGDAAIIPAVWPEDDAPMRSPRLRIKVRGRRSLRTGKLCRPSARGRELCATVREVVYKP